MSSENKNLLIGNDDAETLVLEKQEDKASLNEITDDVLANGKYTSRADGAEYAVDAYATGLGGNDTIIGTDGNDWINGGEGNDEIYGGTAGHDMLSGHKGANKIVAGSKDSDGTLTLSTGYAEIYGGDGNDTIIAGKGDNFIWGHEGDDSVTLNNKDIEGVTNRIVFSEPNFGNDTIFGASSHDTLKFSLGGGTPSGYKLSDLKFSRENNDLLIETKVGSNSVRVSGFFTADNKVDSLQVLSEDGSEQVIAKISEVSDVYINGLSDYVGNDDDQIIILKKGTVTTADDVLADGKYTSNADDNEYTVDAYAAGLGGNDTIIGTDGNDWINGGEGNDEIYGGTAGHDMLSGHKGSNTIVAGVKGSDGKYILNDDGVEMYGGDGNDVMVGSNGDDFIAGHAGNDTITAGLGNDTIFGKSWDANEVAESDADTFIFSAGHGNDVIADADSSDTLKFEGIKLSDVIFFKKGKSLYIQSNRGDENQASVQLEGFFNEDGTIKEGAVDKIYFEGDKKAGSLKNLFNTKGILNPDEYFSNVTKGTVFNEYLEETSEVNDLTGTKKNSWIEGGSSANVIKGTAGYNMLAGNDGDDTIIGGKDFNEVYGGQGKDSITGGNKGNYVWGDGLDNDGKVMGASDPTNNSDFIYGGDGNDTLYGGTGLDRINALGSGNDTIKGGKGNDLIWGGDGNDELSGGAGNDTFGFTISKDAGFGNDIIKDAQNGDVIKLGAYSGAADVYNADLFLNENNLAFTRNGDDLIITAGYQFSDENEKSGDITLEGFFKNASSKNLDAIEGVEHSAIPVGFLPVTSPSTTTDTYSILKNAYIEVEGFTGGTFTGSDYNENISAVKDAKISMGKGNNTIYFEQGKVDGVEVSLTNGERTNLSFDSYSDIEYKVDKNDVLLNVTYGTDSNATVETVRLKNYATKDNNSSLTINEQQFYELFTELNYGLDKIDKKGNVKGSNLSEYIDMRDYTSANGTKGVNINAGGGNDEIEGSYYNDVVKASSGDNLVQEYGGNNKITTGAGNDRILLAGYSSNTVKAGAGSNELIIASNGINKVNSGNDDDVINIVAGNNTVKAGDGNNEVSIGLPIGGTAPIKVESINNITTGKGNDTFQITEGKNTINTGKGNDSVAITGGDNTIKSAGGDNLFTVSANSSSYSPVAEYNTNKITSGGGKDKFIIETSINNLNSGAGDDEFILAGNGKSYPIINNINAGKGNDTIRVLDGINIIQGGAGNDTYEFLSTYYDKDTDTTYAGNLDKTTVNDSKGNDKYDFTGLSSFAGNLVAINDTKGSNTICLGSQFADDDSGVFFSVKVGAKPKTDKKGNIKYSLGKDISFYTDMNDALSDNAEGISITGRANVSSIELGGKEYKLDITSIAQSVASWLSTNRYASTDAVFESKNSDAIGTLLAMYNGGEYASGSITSAKGLDYALS